MQQWQDGYLLSDLDAKSFEKAKAEAIATYKKSIANIEALTLEQFMDLRKKGF